MWLVELVKAVAWPVAVVVVAAWFKPTVASFFPTLLRRAFQVEVPGFFKAKVDAEEQKAVEAPPSAAALDTKAVLAPSPRLAVNTVEGKLRQDIQTVEINSREAILLRALAETRLTSGHEFTYNRIFGSQIAALRQLNLVGEATFEQARQFFSQYSQRYPEMYGRELAFEDWLSFLVRLGHVEQHGNMLRVTEIGRDFLFYLTDRRLPEDKPW